MNINKGKVNVRADISNRLRNLIRILGLSLSLLPYFVYARTKNSSIITLMIR